MSDCKIIIKNQEVQNLHHLKDEQGNVCLDLGEGFKLQRSKFANYLNDLNNLIFDTTLSSSLPSTPHNIEIFDCFINPANAYHKYKLISICIIENECITDDAGLYLITCDDKEINISIGLGLNHWAKKLQNCKLCDIPNFPETIFNPNFSPSSNYSYNGSDWLSYNLICYGSDIYAGGINFETISPYSIPPNLVSGYSLILSASHFRPQIYNYPLIKGLACKIGWNLEAQIFETDKFKRSVSYLIPCNYGIKNKEQLDVTFKTTGNILFNKPANSGNQCIPIQFFEGNNSIYNGEAYSGNGVVCGRYRITLSFEDGLTSTNFNGATVCFLRKPKFSNVGTYSTTTNIIIDEIELSEGNTITDSEITIEGDFDNLNSFDVTDLCVYFKGNFFSSYTIRINAFIEIKGKRKFFEVGDELTLKDIIDEDYNALEYFKGIMHLFNLHPDEKPFINSVEFFPPYTVNNIEGFYKNEFYEITIPEKNKNIELENVNSERYCILQFNDSKDEYIESLELPNELYSNKIDKNYENQNEKKLVNPFFYPTINSPLQVPPNLQLFADATGLGTFTNYEGFNIPKMIEENDSEKWSNCICPRITINKGNVSHADNSNAFVGINYINGATNVISNLIPTTQQVPTSLGAVGVEYPNDLEAIEYFCNLSYETIYNGFGEPTLSLFTFWEKFLQENQQNNKYTVDLLIDQFNYDCIDFRKCVIQYQNGSPIVSRIDSVSGFDYCKILSLVKVVLIPLSNNIFQSCAAVFEICNGLLWFSCEKLNNGLICITAHHTNSNTVIESSSDGILYLPAITSCQPYSKCLQLNIFPNDGQQIFLLNNGSGTFNSTYLGNIIRIYLTGNKKDEIFNFISSCPDNITLVLDTDNGAVNINFPTSEIVALLNNPDNIDIILPSESVNPCYQQLLTIFNQIPTVLDLLVNEFVRICCSTACLSVEEYTPHFYFKIVCDDVEEYVEFTIPDCLEPCNQNNWNFILP